MATQYDTTQEWGIIGRYKSDEARELEKINEGLAALSGSVLLDLPLNDVSRLEVVQIGRKDYAVWVTINGTRRMIVSASPKAILVS